MSNNILTKIGTKIETMNEAINLANEVERIEAVLKVMKDQMKAYVQKNGPIETDSVIWDFNESVSYSFNPEQMKNIAENIVLEGENPWALLSISSSNLKKLGWSDSFINQLGQKKTTKRFISRKK
ncbi:hypothetical protein EYB33_12050 [Lysinibacillus sphaericus]|uniref:hypothetical protein n=1 Tax=Lysinibacillus TaxID=400634 RepID=UPI00084A42F7|nr:hypothetical protein [Lysinibacillus sphaericus]OEC01293.1 hypothetical protein GY31_13430 [Lysinibacillus sphaericus]UDK96992.1 hypothetical protein EYB33_12050 [Lysinibacillus sphaericus]